MSDNYVDVEIPAAKTDVFREDANRTLTFATPHLYPGEGLVFVHASTALGVYFKADDVLNALAKVMGAEITVTRTETTTKAYGA